MVVFLVLILVLLVSLNLVGSNLDLDVINLLEDVLSIFFSLVLAYFVISAGCKIVKWIIHWFMD